MKEKGSLETRRETPDQKGVDRSEKFEGAEELLERHVTKVGQRSWELGETFDASLKGGGDVEEG